MHFTLIAALDQNGVIGFQDSIPWRAPADLKRFKQLTMDKLVLMGRKTYAGLPGPLKGRSLLVLTKSGKTPLPHGGELVFTVGQVLVTYEKIATEVYVGGGEQVYRLLLPLASRLELTVVHMDAAQGDAYFPGLDLNDWKLTAREDRVADEKNPALSFLTYERAATDVQVLSATEPGFWKRVVEQPA